MPRHFVILETIGTNAQAAEPYLTPLSELTGIDNYTLRQKLCGKGFAVLTSSEEESQAKDILSKVKSVGISAAVISDEEIRQTPAFAEARSLKLEEKTLAFFGHDGKEILTISKGDKVVLVAAPLDFKAGAGSLPEALLSGKTSRLEDMDFLKRYSERYAGLLVYSLSKGEGARLSNRRINFSGLGEKNRLSASLNYLALIDEIMAIAETRRLDVNYEFATLPLITKPNMDGNEERFVENNWRSLIRYANYIIIGEWRGLFDNSNSQEGAASGFAPLGAAAGAGMQSALDTISAGGAIPFIAAPFGASAEKIGAAKKQSETPSEEPELQPPPQGVRVSERKGLAGYFDLIYGSAYYILIIYFLMLISFVAFALSGVPFISYGFLGLSLGLYMFFHGFALIKRKRTIENAPTAKIRSLPMGFCEVAGRARPMYAIRAPYSLVDCIYYRYASFKKADNALIQKASRFGHKGQEWDFFTERLLRRDRTRQQGSSGLVPFYIEDETGKVAVLPAGAVLEVTRRQEFTRPDPLGGGNYITIVEELIPVGAPLYIHGFVERREFDSERGRRERLAEKLRELKSDGERMKEFDLNGDGKIDAEEWDIARKKMEREAYKDQMLSEKREEADEIVITSHGKNGLFIISDGKEHQILKRLSRLIPVVLIAGAAVTTLSIAFLIKALFGVDAY